MRSERFSNLKICMPHSFQRLKSLIHFTSNQPQIENVDILIKPTPKVEENVRETVDSDTISICSDTWSCKTERSVQDDGKVNKSVSFCSIVMVCLIPTRKEFSSMWSDIWWSFEECDEFKKQALVELNEYVIEHDCTVKDSVVALYQPDIASLTRDWEWKKGKRIEQYSVFDKFDLKSKSHHHPNHPQQQQQQNQYDYEKILFSSPSDDYFDDDTIMIGILGATSVSSKRIYQSQTQNNQKQQQQQQQEYGIKDGGNHHHSHQQRRLNESKDSFADGDYNHLIFASSNSAKRFQK